jgi:hypothetical protein
VNLAQTYKKNRSMNNAMLTSIEILLIIPIPLVIL